MSCKAGIVFFALFLGALAAPSPDSDDVSQFFVHVDTESRIVGGSLAAAGSHPWMVALIRGRLLTSFVCGGSIIAKRTVLTAAHCIHDNYGSGALLSSLSIQVGSNRWKDGQNYRLSGNATHPHYLHHDLKNDIAMLFTVQPFVYTDHIQPITMSFNYVDAGVQVRAAGWGRTRFNGSTSSELRELIVATISGEQCRDEIIQMAISGNYFRVPPFEEHIEICTKHPNGAGFGMCNGDSGSALVRLDEAGAQVGVVSWGFPCARGAPDMFARLSAYESWVATHIRD